MEKKMENVIIEETEFVCHDCGEKIKHIFYGSADSVCGSFESELVCYECCQSLDDSVSESEGVN
jgi:hypothetical protein